MCVEGGIFIKKRDFTFIRDESIQVLNFLSDPYLPKIQE